MQGLYRELPEAITNTERIAEMCDLKLDFSRLRLPEFNVPQGMTADEHLAQKCWDGLRSRIADVTPELEERLAYELEVISQTQFGNYFLVVWDIARFVRGERYIVRCPGECCGKSHAVLSGCHRHQPAFVSAGL